MRSFSRAMPVLLATLLAISACGGPNPPTSAPPTTAPPTAPRPAPSDEQSRADSLDLEVCDPERWATCMTDDAHATITLVGTGLRLTYDSRWAVASDFGGTWSARSLGLGGWSLDVIDRYVESERVWLPGDGSWRRATPTDLGGGERAIAHLDDQLVDVFDEAGRHVRTIDGILGATTLMLSYDAAGRVIAVDGHVEDLPVALDVERSESGGLVAFVGAGGARTDVVLDQSEHLVGLRDPMGAGTSISVDAAGRPTAIVDAMSGRTEFSYDSAGRLVSETDPDGTTTTFTRTQDALALRLISTTELGRTSEMDAAALPGGGVRRTLRSSSGATSEVVRAADGSLTVTRSDGSIIEVGVQPDPRWGMDVPLATPIIVRRADGMSRRIETTMTVEASDPLRPDSWSSTITDDGSRSTTTLDARQRTLTTTDPIGHMSSDSFDTAGRLVDRVRPGAARQTWTYDDAGRLRSTTIGEGPLAATTTFDYDRESGIVNRTEPDGAITRFAVDGRGQVVRSTDNTGEVVVLDTDPVGRLIGVRAGDRLGAHLGVTLGGRPTGFLPPTSGGSNPERRRYDADGLLMDITGPADRKITFAWDEKGRLAGWSAGSNSVRIVSDPRTGRAVSSVSDADIATEYTYAADRLSGIAWSGPGAASVSRTLDTRDRVATEVVAGTEPVASSYDMAGSLVRRGAVAFTRDPASGLVREMTQGAVVTTLAYDAAGRLARSTTTVGGSTVLDRRYGRDIRGRLISVVTEDATGSSRQESTWDAAGRLAMAEVDGVTTAYEYDAAGNLLSSTTGDRRIEGAYDVADRLVQWGETSWMSDAAGNLVQGTGPAGTIRLSVDATGTLRGVTSPSGREITYIIDGTGQRVGREVGGRRTTGYVPDPDGRIVAISDANGRIDARFTYDEAGFLVAMDRGGTSYSIVTDQVGSPLAVIDASTGRVAQNMRYDVRGHVISDTAPGFQPFGFAGGLLDPDTYLVHFGAREYDSTVGRWTSPDPLRYEARDVNLYRYAGGDPVNSRDPTGLSGLYEFCLGSCTGTTRPGGKYTCEGVYCEYHPEQDELVCIGFFGRCGKSDGPYDGGPPEGCRGALYCRISPPQFVCLGKSCPNIQGDCKGFCSFGDPHLTSADGVQFDFQAAGEFDAIASHDGRLRVQVRSEPLGDSGLITVNTAIAALVDGDRIGIYPGKGHDEATIRVGGKAVLGDPLARALPGGGTLERSGSEITLRWRDGTAMSITAFGGRVDYAFTPAPDIGPGLIGLHGSQDGQPENDVASREGTVLVPGAADFQARLYAEFANSWRIDGAASLFDYAKGTSTATFTDRSMPRAIATVDTLDGAVRAAAEATCRAFLMQQGAALDACILDVGLTGDAGYAASAVAAAAGMADIVDPAAPTPRHIFVGMRSDGTLTRMGQQVRYTFTAEAGDVVFLDATGPCTTGLLWALRGPSGSPISATDDSCDDLGRVALPDAGTYTIALTTDRAATGAFAFALSAVPPVVRAPVKVGDTVRGSISAPGAWREYTFTAEAGDVVFLDATGPCTTGLLWALRGPSGSPISATDDSCDDLGRVALPDAGTYTIALTTDRAATGAFAFALSAVPPVVRAPVKVGDTVRGSISAPGAWREYTFTAEAGDVVFLDATGPCTTGLLWALRGPSGSPISATDDSCDDLGRVALPDAGTYTIRVSSDAVATGAFAFALQAGD